MRVLARIHSWFGWLVALALLVWTASGLVATAKPDHVRRGDAYLKNAEPRPLPPGWLAAQLIEGEDRPIEMRTRVQGNSVVTSAIYSDGKIERYFARSGEPVPEIDMASARTIVAMEIAGGDEISAVTFFGADNSPPDFARDIPVWQVALTNGTNVYVGRETGMIEAVRTQWWRTAHRARTIHTMGGDTKTLRIFAYGLLALLSLVLLSSFFLSRGKKHAPRKEAEMVQP